MQVADGSTLTLDGTYTIDQPLVVGTGSTLNLNGDWANTSTITATDATLNLGGSFTLDDLGTLSRSGGTVNITGTLDLEGQTLTLNAATGDWVLNGGTIQNGTINTADGAQLLASTSSSNRLRDVVVAGDVDLAVGRAALRIDNVTVDGTLTLSGNTSSLAFEGDQTLNGTGQVVLSAQSGAVFEMASEGTLTIAAGLTVRGEGNLASSRNFGRTMSLINQGTIIADVSGQTLIVGGQGTGGTFTNQGTLIEENGGILNVQDQDGNLGGVEVADGSTLTLDGTYTIDQPLVVGTGSTLNLNGDWANTSTITATDATLNLGGSFTLDDLGTLSRSGGTVNITGTLDLEGQTLTLNAATGDWVLNGGTIQNGTINTADGAQLLASTSSSNRLRDVVVAGDVDLAVGRAALRIDNVTVDGTLTLSGNTSSLAFEGDQTLNGTGQVVLSAQSGAVFEMASEGTLTIAAGLTVRGEGNLASSRNFGRTMSLINQGTIIADVSGQTLIVGGQGTDDTFTNQGTLRAKRAAATLNVQNLDGNDGLVQVAEGSTLTLDGTYRIDQPLTGWHGLDAGPEWRLGQHLND